MQFNLLVITPLGTYLDKKVLSLNIKSKSGWIGILPNHASLITAIETCNMSFKTTMHKYNFAIGGGVMFVDNNVVKVLVDFAYSKDQIDIKAIEELKENALKRLELAKTNEEKDLAKKALNEASSQFDTYNSEGRVRIGK